MYIELDFITKDNLEMITTIATVIIAITAVVGIIITTNSLRTSIDQFKEQLQLSVFTDYTKKYQDIMLNFPETINQDDFDFNKLDKSNDTTIKDKTLRYMRAYFDLCSEECFLYGQGKIGENTWNEWKMVLDTLFQKLLLKKAGT